MSERFFDDETDEAAREPMRRLAVFELSGELYGVPLTGVSEVRTPLPVTPLPNVPEYVLGLINLRGNLIPLIDLRRRFDMPLLLEGPTSRLLVLRGPGYAVALWADAVHDLARLPESGFQPAPSAVASIDAEFYREVTSLNGLLLIVVDIPRLIEATALQGTHTP
jgi:purine-binding chemotaxis protein CheW